MLPREIVEELIRRDRAIGLHILVTLANGLKGFVIVLALPFQILGQGLPIGLDNIRKWLILSA